MGLLFNLVSVGVLITFAQQLLQGCIGFIANLQKDISL